MHHSHVEVGFQPRASSYRDARSAILLTYPYFPIEHFLSKDLLLANARCAVYL